MTDTFTSAGQLAGHLPGLLLEAERVARVFMRGAHGRRRVGQGEAFWQFRPWEAGDSRRDIDWKQTAKRDGVFVREREWEAAQTLWLWRDSSASMDFSSSKKLSTKKETAEILLLALAMLALDGGEQAGLLGADLAPQAHHNAASRLAEYLPRQSALSEGARAVAARSHLVLFSDFYFDLAELSAFCGDLARRSVRGLLVRIADPSECSLPCGGRVKFLDMEGAAPPVTFDRAESLRALYEEKYQAHRAALFSLAQAAGWSCLDFTTDVPREAILSRVYGELAVKK